MKTTVTITPKERPIIFTAPNVRTIQRDEKTQTRRIVKPQPGPNEGLNGDTLDPLKFYITTPSAPFGDLDRKGRCPYEVGMRLWVRETWQAFNPGLMAGSGRGVLGRMPMRVYAYPPIEGESEIEYRADRENDMGNWRSSIHMPRWASRITLEVTDVRVERLNDIEAHDVVAEGLDDPAWHQSFDNSDGDFIDESSPIEAFCDLWESIHGKGAWELNPWVWVVEFKRVLEAR